MADRAARLVIVLLAQRMPVVFEKCTPIETHTARLKLKSSLTKILSVGRFLKQDFDKTTFKKTKSHTQFSNLADEAVRMPVGAERGDETVGDWILTAVALGRKQSEEVTSAVRHAILDDSFLLAMGIIILPSHGIHHYQTHHRTPNRRSTACGNSY